MTQPDDFVHRPVMVDEVVDLLASVPAGWLVDCTVGGGGHARALLEHAGDFLSHPAGNLAG